MEGAGSEAPGGVRADLVIGGFRGREQLVMRLEGAGCSMHCRVLMLALPAAAVRRPIPSHELAIPAGRYGL